MLEHATLGRDVRFPNDDGVGGDLRIQRYGIASAGHSDRLRINRCGTILAHHSVGPFVEADRAADFAGIENRGDFSVWFLVDLEANRRPVFMGGITMQISILNLRERNADLAVHKSHFGCR